MFISYMYETKKHKQKSNSKMLARIIQTENRNKKKQKSITSHRNEKEVAYVSFMLEV